MTFDPSKALHSGQGFFPPNLVAIGHCWANWPLLDPSWPLHDLWPQQCTKLWSGVLPTKFGGHGALLSKLTPAWPQLTPTWLLTQQCITPWSGILPIKFGDHWVQDIGHHIQMCQFTSSRLSEQSHFISQANVCHSLITWQYTSFHSKNSETYGR